LHTLPSLHDVPFVSGGCWQPATVSQVSVVQALLSLQLSGVPDVHAPAWQVSAPLQTLPSLHEVPFATAVFEQMPAVQTSVVHGLLSLQSELTLHGTQPGVAVCTHPETGLQVSVVQALLSVQLSGVPAVHVPAWQLSAPLHTLPSLHDVPFVTAAC